MKDKRKVVDLNIYDLVTKQEYDSIKLDKTVSEEILTYSKENEGGDEVEIKKKKKVINEIDNSKALTDLESLKKEMNDLDANNEIDILISFEKDGEEDEK